MDAFNDRMNGSGDFVLPDAENCPAEGRRKFRRSLVTSRVVRHLLSPQLGVRACPWRPSAVFGAAMPEAPVNKDGYPVPREDKVGSAATSDVQAEPIAGPVESAA